MIRKEVEIAGEAVLVRVLHVVDHHEGVHGLHVVVLVHPVAVPALVIALVPALVVVRVAARVHEVAPHEVEGARILAALHHGLVLAAALILVRPRKMAIKEILMNEYDNRRIL